MPRVPRYLTSDERSVINAALDAYARLLDAEADAAADDEYLQFGLRSSRDLACELVGVIDAADEILIYF